MSAENDLRDALIAEIAPALRRARRPDLKSKRDIAALDAAPLTERDLKPAAVAADVAIRVISNWAANEPEERN